MLLPATRRGVRFKYNHWLLRRILRNAKGITFGHTVLFKYPRESISYETHVHEVMHVRQVEQKGRLRFYVGYLWLLLRHGYKQHPYEAEVRRATDQWVERFKDHA